MIGVVAEPRGRVAGDWIERATVMHGTSRVRARSADLLADIVRRTGAEGAAYGWCDALGPDLMVPVHQVAAAGVVWDRRLARTHTIGIDEAGPLRWTLMIRGADERAIERVTPLLARAVGWFMGAHERELPEWPQGTGEGPCASFLDLLDAFRSIGFEIGARDEMATYRTAFGGEVSHLPQSVRPAAQAVVDAIPYRHRLGTALLRLGADLDVAGALAEAATVHGIGYELAIRNGDAVGGIEAARWSGRAYRKLADWPAAFRWYGLASRIAQAIGDLARQARVLDGEGNTHRHRGSFPAARRAHEEAWELALASGDPGAISSIAHSMMTMEREAGRHASAARYAWAALERSRDPEDRANLLINIGTLLRDAGSLPSAVEAYELARSMSRDPTTRMMAADALAYCAAVGGPADHRAWSAIAKRESRGMAPYLRAQVGYFRGAGLHALGRVGDARRMLRAVERYASRAGLHQWEVKAAELAEAPLPQPEPTDAPTELRQGLRMLRDEHADMMETVG